MRALVAMSGGVDSSVAAALMLDRGFDVVGVTLKQWEDANGLMPAAGCCTVGDAEDARRVAAQLDIPYYVLDYVEEFTAAVVDPFGMDYLAGRTPNPCVECNRKVRFAALLQRTELLGCDVLVTGHHARVKHDEHGWHLLKAVDDTKDQSYVLHMLNQEQLSRIQLPVGEMTKAEVRRRAASLGLRTADKPDSQDLCFVGNGDYREFLRRRHPETTAPGEIVDTAGRVIGRHQGTAGFTIGQRKGIGVALGEPRYVVRLEPANRRVVIGTKDEQAVGGCDVGNITFVSGQAPGEREIDVKVRYRAQPVPARLVPHGGEVSETSEWTVLFDDPQDGVAPGQAAVFYHGDEVVGGGTITASVTRATTAGVGGG